MHAHANERARISRIEIISIIFIVASVFLVGWGILQLVDYVSASIGIVLAVIGAFLQMVASRRRRRG